MSADVTPTTKATMTLNLTAQEMAVVEELAAQADISKTALMRQALRVYQAIVVRQNRGEQIMFSGDPPMKMLFVGPGFDVLPNTEDHP